MDAAGLSRTTVELDAGESIPNLDDFDILLVMGGPMDVWEQQQHPWLVAEKAAIRYWVQTRKSPYLGLCLGHQLLADTLGGTVAAAETPEIGVMSVQLTASGERHPLFAGLPTTMSVLQWHSAEVLELPQGGEVLAYSDACAVNAMAYGACAFGLQYHVELTARTVDEWSAIPEYANALRDSCGAGALESMRSEADARLAEFQSSAAAIFANFLQIARAAS